MKMSHYVPQISKLVSHASPLEGWLYMLFSSEPSSVILKPRKNLVAFEKPTY